MATAEQDSSVPGSLSAVLEQLDLPFSDEEGYGPENFNYTCPTTGNACRAKLRLISQYTRDIDEHAIESGSADEDVALLSLKLREYSLWGAGVTCTPTGACEIRQAMDDSIVRQKAVKGIRRVREWLIGQNWDMGD